MSTSTLDAVVVGAGPSGLSASLALSGWIPHLSLPCETHHPTLSQRLSRFSHLFPSASPSLDNPTLPASTAEDALPPLLDPALLFSLSHGLRGRSNHPLALLFDALHHPAADLGVRSPSCLMLRHSPRHSLSHLVVDPLPFGGNWHIMHDATLTLSPGFWMELPSFPLAHHIAHTSPATLIDAERQAASRQERGLIASYYNMTAHRFNLSRHRRAARVLSASYNPHNATTHGDWTVQLDDGSPPLRSHALVLATGASGMPRELELEGEALRFVHHRCTQPGRSGRVVMVVGAGLSAADCTVYHLRQGRSVVHAFRGDAGASKLGSKFCGVGARAVYPEYFSLCQAMASSSKSPIPLFGGSYLPIARAQLKVIHPDGRCQVDVAGKTGLADHRTEDHHVHAVFILIGSTPDLSFLSAEVRHKLESRGPPSNTIDGVQATHPVFLDVNPYTTESGSVPTLYALGPLRGDNFVRFAIHDGHETHAQTELKDELDTFSAWKRMSTDFSQLSLAAFEDCHHSCSVRMVDDKILT
ncbi:MAG: hypothetical protein SGPRY_002121 [Prymnesium sp.]